MSTRTVNIAFVAVDGGDATFCQMRNVVFRIFSTVCSTEGRGDAIYSGKSTWGTEMHSIEHGSRDRHADRILYNFFLVTNPDIARGQFKYVVFFSDASSLFAKNGGDSWWEYLRFFFVSKAPLVEKAASLLSLSTLFHKVARVDSMSVWLLVTDREDVLQNDPSVKAACERIVNTIQSNRYLILSETRVAEMIDYLWHFLCE